MKNRQLLLTFIPTIILAGIYGYHFLTGLPPILMMLLAILSGILVQILFYLLFKLIQFVFKGIDTIYILALLSGVSTLVALKVFGFGWPDALYYALAGTALLIIVCLWWFLRTKSLFSFLMLSFGCIGLGYGIYLLANQGSEPYQNDFSKFSLGDGEPSLEEIGVENPATLGSFEVDAFTYGSGSDKKRTEYAQEVRFQTPTVDASLLLPEWKGKKKKWREKFWGFGVTEFPLNGRVYMPQGEGPFPLALIVHGNHSMIDYSDDGYGYLGNLLASRGIITVSVDENFVNGHWSGDFRGKEMPVRAWLLLKHLEQWQQWNNDSAHELSGKVDMENIMLMGHSRGGEAVTIAGGYNRLPFFPDNAQVPFDFNFNIKGIVSIAPTDYRYDRKIALKDVDYLSLQGSYDSDEVSFWGLRPYRRLQFTDSIPRYKAGVYVHHANHGQFNSTWGKSDFGAPMKWLLNLEPLLSAEEQQQVAQVFISAFAESVLKNNDAYIPIFKNVACAKDWLPDEFLMTHFEASDFVKLVDFEEDIDITTVSDSISIRGHHLNLWKEQGLKTRDNGRQDNNAVVLGWHISDSTSTDTKPIYEIISDTSFWKDSIHSIQLSIGSGDPKWLKLDSKETDVEGDKDADPKMDYDFSLVLTDTLGQSDTVKISDIKNIIPPLKTKFTKFEFLDKDMIGDAWEVQLQTFHIPISKFEKNASDFDPKAIKHIRFVFDQSPKGVVVVDDIGYNPLK
ncbi:MULTISPECIES: hypothetical protein [Maribacter]|uniref:Alpha/beta hydrolase n=1 Tax=Maribacter flavus TaxID=1658664 RepID=A0ABU7IK81_9FLAO|nr:MULTISPECIES: hypothetical protein [Maribacter]MDC6405941.1 hypothetical protein [Maribacter sp. PR66]MEE1973274.1 hypothetical protein [Maribacter flavus]